MNCRHRRHQKDLNDLFTLSATQRRRARKNHLPPSTTPPDDNPRDKSRSHDERRVDGLSLLVCSLRTSLLKIHDYLLEILDYAACCLCLSIQVTSRSVYNSHCAVDFQTPNAESDVSSTLSLTLSFCQMKRSFLNVKRACPYCKVPSLDFGYM